MALFDYTVTVTGGALPEATEFSVEASSLDRAIQSALFVVQSQAPYAAQPYELHVVQCTRPAVARRVQWRNLAC